MATELRVEHLAAGYGKLEIVRDINFTVRAGQRIGLLGRNGAGKSTTLAAVVGLAQRLQGTITLNGQDISTKPTYRRATAGISLVPQGRDIFPSLTVEENLLAGLNGRPSREALEFAYGMFPRLRDRRANGGSQLSGGEQQMLAVARALVGQPQILLLDEPLEGLAPQSREELMETIIQMTTRTGIGCLLIEQDVDVVLDFADQVLVLENGRCLYAGTSEALRKSPEILEQTIGLGKVQ